MRPARGPFSDRRTPSRCRTDAAPALRGSRPPPLPTPWCRSLWRASRHRPRNSDMPSRFQAWVSFLLEETDASGVPVVVQADSCLYSCLTRCAVRRNVMHQMSNSPGTRPLQNMLARVIDLFESDREAALNWFEYRSQLSAVVYQ